MSRLEANPEGGKQGFWHRQAPVDSLCLYRAVLGICLGADALSWAPYAEELFSSSGLHLGPFARWAPPPGVAVGLCLALATSAALVTLGLFTRPSLLATLLLWGYLYAIDRLNEKAISSIVLVLLLILLFSACGARYSIDDWRRRRRGRARQPGAACIFPLRLLQLEFAQVYFFAGLVKLMNPGWLSGDVLKHSLTSRWATELGVWVSSWLSDFGARAAGQTTIAYELLAPFLLFVPRLRPWVIGVGLAFHISIWATLSVGALTPHFLLALLLLYPDPQTLARRAAALKARCLRVRGAKP